MSLAKLKYSEFEEEDIYACTAWKTALLKCPDMQEDKMSFDNNSIQHCRHVSDM